MSRLQWDRCVCVPRPQLVREAALEGRTTLTTLSRTRTAHRPVVSPTLACDVRYQWHPPSNLYPPTPPHHLKVTGMNGLFGTDADPGGSNRRSRRQTQPDPTKPTTAATAKSSPSAPSAPSAQSAPAAPAAQAAQAAPPPVEEEVRLSRTGRPVRKVRPRAPPQPPQPARSESPPAGRGGGGGRARSGRSHARAAAVTPSTTSTAMGSTYVDERDTRTANAGDEWIAPQSVVALDLLWQYSICCGSNCRSGCVHM
jgi:hypothetical protein